MKCPICKKELNDTKYKPFCCKRCADIDLGNWFSEKYTIAAENLNDKDMEELQEALLPKENKM